MSKNRGAVNSAKLGEILAVFREHRVKGLLQELLEEKGLARTGDWGTVEQRIREAHKDGAITVEELLETLDETELFAKKHIFMYRLPDNVVTALSNKQKVTAAVSQVDASIVMNAPIFVAKSSVPKLAMASHDDDELVLKWVETRKWWEPSGQKESDNGRKLTKTYDLKEDRAVGVVHVYLKTKVVEVRIHVLHTGQRQKYAAELAKFRALVKPVLDLTGAEEISLAKGVKSILESSEVSARSGLVRTDVGTAILLTSASENDNFIHDEFYKAGCNVSGGTLSAEGGNVYWLEDGANIAKKLHTLIHHTNEVTVLASTARRRAIEHVLSRIRAFAA